MSSPFRTEVAQAQTAQYMGTIRIGRNPAFEFVAVLALALAAALIAFGIWGEVTRKARVPGLLVPVQGAIQITAQAVGVVTDIHAVDGQKVSSGDRLFLLNTDRVGANGDTARLVSAALRQRAATLDSERRVRELQASQRRQILSSRIRDLQVEIEAAGRESQLADQRVSLARKNLERFQSLATSGFVADVQVQQKQEELLDLQARRDSALRTANSLARELASAKAELGNVATQLASDQVQLELAVAAISQEKAENEPRNALLLLAPQEGYLGTIHINKRAAVQTGQVLATFIPASEGQDSSLEAHRFAPSCSAGFVQVGQAAWLRLAAYPYQKFGMTKGVVKEVSTTPITPQDLPPGQGNALLQAAQSSEPLYRIKVSLDSQSLVAYGQPQQLKPGMSLEADVVQDKRAVWEWLLEPVLATERRLQILGDSSLEAAWTTATSSNWR